MSVTRHRTSCRDPRFPGRVILPALLLVLSAFAGCGFHLQGRTPLPAPLAVTFIEAGNGQSDFVQDLRKALLASGARLVREPSAATAKLRILRDEVSRTVLSVSATNIPREYELTYAVRFSVEAGGRELLAPRDVSLSRDYSFDEQQMLAKTREEELLREALARDLVGIVMRQLASL